MVIPTGSLYAQRKPHNQAYQLTQYHLFSFDEETGEFESDGTTTVKSFDMKRYVQTVC